MQLKRNGEIFEIKNFAIEISGKRFWIEELPEGKININKVSIEGPDYISIYPVSSDEIEIS